MSEHLPAIIIPVNVFDKLVIVGPLSMGNNIISNVSDPISDQDAATKLYVDNIIDDSPSASTSTTTSYSSSKINSIITNPTSDPTTDAKILALETKTVNITATDAITNLAGGANLNSNKLINVETGTDDTDGINLLQLNNSHTAPNAKILALETKTQTLSSGLIDDVSHNADTASLIISLRLVNPYYSGKCVNIRRSSDDALSDIPFSLGYLDKTAYDTFVGAGDGYIAIIYDQSGNGHNFIQATNSLQPQIVWETIATNEIPVIQWNGGQIMSGLDTGNFGMNDGEYCISTIFKSSSPGIMVPWGNVANNYSLNFQNNGNIQVIHNSTVVDIIGANPLDGTYHRLSDFQLSGSLYIRYDGVKSVSTATNVPTTVMPLFWGAANTTGDQFYYKGVMSELIIYDVIPSDAKLLSVENEQVSLWSSGTLPNTKIILNMGLGLTMTSTTDSFTPPKLTTVERALLHGREGNVIYNTSLSCLNVYSNNAWEILATKKYVDDSGGVLPDMRMNGYNFNSVKKYIESISAPNVNSETLVCGYTAVALGTNAYAGGVYSPTQNRIYFVPHGQSDQTTWHYIDCDTGALVGYTVVALETNAYSGGVYSPTQNRIYFVPYEQSNETTWHYIDCNTEALVGYTVVAIANNAYDGGVYSPTQNRIYFVPVIQSGQTTWHYIDCDTGDLVDYTVTALSDGAYAGGVYSPTQNRIYFVPFNQSNQTTWHYIDCNTGALVGYTVVAIANDAYLGGVYSPTQNRIYFIPARQSDQTTWHYIDCDTGALVGYTVVALTNNAYIGGVYCPTQNRIYFVPNRQAGQTTWHYLKPLTTANCSISLASSTIMNNY
jgi:hypothetical protein